MQQRNNLPESKVLENLNEWPLFDSMINKTYLDFISKSELVRAEPSLEPILKRVRVDKIHKIVYDRQEDNLTKLNNVLSAMYASGSTVFMVLKGSFSETILYLGTRSNSPLEAATAMQTYERALYGNFPGLVAEPLANNEVQLIANDILDKSNRCIAAVTGIPSIKDDDAVSFSQGIEKLIDAMQGHDYLALFLSTPIQQNVLDQVEIAYQNIYSDLSLMNISQLALSKQESISLGSSISQGISESLSQSISQTNSITETESISHTSSNSVTKGRSYQLSGTPIVLAGALLGGPVGAGIAGVLTAFLGSRNSSAAQTKSDTRGLSSARSVGTTSTVGASQTNSKNETSSATVTTGGGSTYQYEVKNRRITSTLTLLDEQLERLRGGKNYGAWNWAAYFIGPDITTIKMGASIFSGILRGEASGVERNAISLWTRNAQDSFASIQEYLANFQHPVFSIGDWTVSPTSILNTSELSVGMSLPQKSLPGLPVFNSAEFGRSVSSRQNSDPNDKCCELGSVYHLGLESKSNPVRLHLNSLAAHTFITGSTGSGKTNAIYVLLDHLLQFAHIPFLVVEPTKGEYQKIFGGHRRVSVYGTNPYKTPLLRINPFSFPDDIHVIEHIDRLIEVLNAVWPMYAAMPAILKEAVERTYKRCGWDLLTSRNKYSPSVFPDFQDLIEVLPVVIASAGYSDEVKSNYIGALVTRVKSLTNGYYKTIFQKDELKASELFDHSCIIDISRTGSPETIALLMGIVFLKLQEYRLATKTEENMDLKHITVLEEAHLLLRRTSVEQTADTSNLRGKSVEMISNAIAEMRTYGEGFIIADQAPGLLDPTAIRNTNTKVVFSLHDGNDRQLVGGAQHLNNQQTDELACLERGVASVYQSDWQEAVLCKCNLFDSNSLFPFSWDKEKEIEKDSRTKARQLYLFAILKAFVHNEKMIFEEGDLSMINSYYPGVKEVFLRSHNEGSLSMLLQEVLHLGEYLKRMPPSDDCTKWMTELIQSVAEGLVLASDEEKDLFLKGLFKSMMLSCSKQENSSQRNLWSEQYINSKEWRYLL